LIRYIFYIFHRKVIATTKFFVTHRPMRNSGVHQPRSYDDSVTYKYKIQIRVTLRIIQKIILRHRIF